MPPQTLAAKVESLERRVTNLEMLPERMDRMESQIVQLRTEMRDGFSAVRAEIRAVDEVLRSEIRAVDEALRSEIRAGDEETRHLMRVLHEKVIGRFALLDEGRGSNGVRKRRRGQ